MVGLNNACLSACIKIYNEKVNQQVNSVHKGKLKDIVNREIKKYLIYQYFIKTDKELSKIMTLRNVIISYTPRCKSKNAG